MFERPIPIKRYNRLTGVFSGIGPFDTVGFQPTKIIVHVLAVSRPTVSRLHSASGDAVIDQKVESRFYELKRAVIQKGKFFVGLAFQLKFIGGEIEIQNVSRYVSGFPGKSPPNIAIRSVDPV